MRHVIGLIRVITIRDEELLNLHGKIVESAFPELRVISRSIEDQPMGIYDRESEEVAKPKIIKLAKELEREGVEAVIVSCAADPAVRESRKLLRIPVVGAGSAAASLALTYGDRVGVLNLAEETPEVVRDILGKHLVAEAKPEGVRNTLDLMTGWGIEAARKILEELLKRDVDVILLACTGYSTIGFSRVAERLAGVPVVDPVIAAGAVTLGMLRQKALGGGK
ncbi:MAG: aspartate/glutamate racemase family protein [Sulfolobales archaeon]|nr:aspartate/glutamate racemase family protein [Sulfolobales archaeon]MDW8083478.1 aspartate/glutamate racemase family protein [Sulfolobales archaeon]